MQNSPIATWMQISMQTGLLSESETEQTDFSADRYPKYERNNMTRYSILKCDDM